MKRFSIRILNDLEVQYNHYLSFWFINKIKVYHYYNFERDYPLRFSSRKLDKPAIKYKDGACIWELDDEWHRVGRPAVIYSDGNARYYENGEWIK